MAKKLKVLVVLNPAAQSDKVEMVKNRLRDLKATADFLLHETEKKEDVMASTREAITEGFDMVVAAGGDGTVSSVAGGLVDSGVPLCIVPIGTANVFAKVLEIPEDPIEAIELITDAHAQRRIDLIQLDGHYYLLHIGVGLTPSVVSKADRSNKTRFGFFAYAFAALAGLLGRQPNTYTITVDGSPRSIQASEVLAVNSPALGVPVFEITKLSRPDDGLLDVCVFRTNSLWDYLVTGLNVLLGKGASSSRKVDCLSPCKEVAIEANPVQDIQGDGDIIGTTPFVARLKAEAVTILVPEKQG